MQAAVLAGPRRIELRTTPVPEPAPGEVLVAYDGCGVCGSNLPVWEGRPWFEYPLAAGAPGHEAWGRIEAVGDGVTELRPGQAVAVLSEAAFAEAGVVSAGAAVPLPAALDGRPFPGEALGCAFNVAARGDFRAGQTVAVVGVGFIGAVVVALAAQAGARVIAISRRPYSLEVARAMGAAEVIRMDDHERVVARVHELTGDGWCERVVEAVGAQWPLDLAGEITGVRGRLVIAGFHQDGARTVNLQLWNWRGIDVINAHEREQEVALAGIRAAADAAASGSLDASPLYTHTFPLARLDQAMDALLDRPEGFLKALVTT
jgi:threonine dehydrogenase-like Zn-dependent dehydrogenase